ncbi:MAG: hypothetical protein ACXABL_15115 [Candidatus Thorarchaeota archaeon]|jgi:hypothetical protein
MVTDIESKVALHETGDNPRTIFLVQTEEQQTTLQHSVRKEILKVLAAGISDFETETRSKVNTLEDGTAMTHLVEVRRPIRRYWMSVPEIVKELQKRHPKPRITNYQCYYHLQKICNQGLAEQDPHSNDDSKGKKKRIRGKRYRIAARFFISYQMPDLQSHQSSAHDLLSKGWGINVSEEDGERLKDLMSQQDKALFDALKHLAANLIESENNCVTLPVMLERLAHVYLSNDENFIERYRDVQEILVRYGGRLFEPIDTVVDSKGDQVNE